jgi:hypothetical protein
MWFRFPRKRVLLWMAMPLLLLGARGAGRLALAAETGAVRDVSGVAHRPLEAKGRRATLLFFIAHDCPIANRYAPEINRICREYAARKVACYVVYVEPDLPSREARDHAKAYGYPCPALLDTGHQLVRKAGATVTPEAAVFGSDGRLRYRGRIDDRYLDFGEARLQPTTRDLRLALESILQGRPAPNARTKAVGCFIAGRG